MFQFWCFIPRQHCPVKMEQELVISSAPGPSGGRGGKTQQLELALPLDKPWQGAGLGTCCPWGIVGLTEESKEMS